MAAGLGFKEFTTGDVLTAADANGYLASQVVMVFASAAARTSAIASPQEGMISFLKDTNSTEYYSGTAWVAIGGAPASPGLVLIQTTSTGGSVSSINFGSNASPIFSSTYDNYRITFVGTASGGLNPQMRMRADTTNATGADYNDQYLNVTGTTVNAARSTGLTYNGLPPLNTTVGAFTIDLYSPFLATPTSYYAVGPSTISTISFQGWAGNHTLSTSYNGFGILTGGASTINGTFYIYGLAK
jgi:hypothetical protein